MFFTIDTRFTTADYVVLDNAGLCLVQKIKSAACEDLFPCFFRGVGLDFTPVVTVKSGITSTYRNLDFVPSMFQRFTDICISVTAESLGTDSRNAITAERVCAERKLINWRSAAGRNTYRRSAVYRL